MSYLIVTRSAEGVELYSILHADTVPDLMKDTNKIVKTIKLTLKDSLRAKPDIVKRYLQGKLKEDK